MERAVEEGVDASGDYDPEEVASAKEVLQSLTKTTKTLKIYLPNNPIHQKFINQLFENIQSHLETFGILRLRIKRFELYHSGQSIYENSDRFESIAFQLFVDGLRELSFHPGLDPDEMIDFLNVLGREEESEGEDDDLVTLLWERHFSHIQYVVVDDLQGELEEMEQCKEMQAKPPTPQQLKEVYQQEAEVAPSALAPKGIEIPSLHIFKLKEEEIEAIKRELRWEAEIDIVGELEGMLFDIIRIERAPDLFSEVLDIIDNILEQLMLKGDFGYAEKILAFYQEMLGPSITLEPELVALVQKVLVRAGDPERMLKIVPVLNKLSSEQIDEFVSCMVLFNQEVSSSLIELLALVDTMKARRALCDVLVEFGKKDFDSIVSKLKDERWFLLRNLIYILGKIGDTRAIEYLPQFIGHEELKVRKEVLHVLDAMEDPRAQALLVDFLPDPDLSNRVYAIKSLAKKGIKSGLPLLMEMIISKEFDEKPLYEKKEIFAAAAQLGGDEVVQELQNYLKKGWSLIRKVQVDERGICAASALQRIGSEKAVAALLYGSDSKNKVIREACQKSLSILKVHQD